VRDGIGPFVIIHFSADFLLPQSS